MSMMDNAKTFAWVVALGSLVLWGVHSCNMAESDASLPKPAELTPIEGVIQDSAFDECAYTYRVRRSTRCRAVAIVRIQVGTVHIDVQTAVPQEGVELSSIAEPKLIGRPVKALVGRPCSKIELACAYEFVVAGDRLITMSDQQERQAKGDRLFLWMTNIAFVLFLISAAANIFSPTSLYAPPDETA